MMVSYASILIAGLMSVGVAADAPSLSWPVLLDGVRENPDLAESRERLLGDASKAVSLEIVQRPHSLAEVGTHRTWLDGRSNALEDEIRETFALAMADFGACNALAGELPLLAAAYRLTGDDMLRTRVLAQLEEMAAWSPLQRPGWTLYHPGARLPEGGQDGNWLATGCGVRALADTIEIMPEGSIPSELRARLDQLLEKEIAGVVDDWQTRRPWFVSSDNPITNQWVLPTEGLVRACLVLGRDTRQDAYELGVANLLKALDAHGPKGEFEEGIGYASFTVNSLLNAARAMAVAGDRRAIDHPFLRNFPTWMVHHFQPADMMVNCFDAGPARNSRVKARPLLSLLAVCTGSAAARWALGHYVAGSSDDLAGLAARALPAMPADAAPPLFASYERATRVNWRDHWRDDGSGVWVRGGHPLDQHDHCDRGHVNFICRGKPILIEAGTPSYDYPLMGSHMASGAGHNILQLGALEPHQVDAGDTLEQPGWQKRGVVAPITVKRLDETGGDVSLEITSGYDGLKRWARSVSWDAGHVEVHDDVALNEGAAEIVLFRWHLGTNEDATIAGEGTKWTASWPDAEMRLESDAPIVVTQAKMPDNVINTPTNDLDPATFHTCLIVRTADRLTAVKTRMVASCATANRSQD